MGWEEGVASLGLRVRTALVVHRLWLVVPRQRLSRCFPTYDVEGKKQFRVEAMAIIQELCDKRLVTKECTVRAGSVLNVPEGHRYVRCSLSVFEFCEAPMLAPVGRAKGGCLRLACLLCVSVLRCYFFAWFVWLRCML